jgi:hypothetical protein
MYGGLPKGVPEVHAMVRSVMAGMLDAFQDVPRGGARGNQTP